MSLEVQAGEIFGFLGHNSTGKTTTEVSEEQIPTALGVLRSLPELVLGEPAQPNGAKVVTINKRESIPEVLACLAGQNSDLAEAAQQGKLQSLQDIEMGFNGQAPTGDS